MSTITVVMLGGGAVGKSSLTVQQVSGQFVENYDPTIGDSYRVSVMYNGNAVFIDIVDTAGQEEYAALRDGFIRKGDVFVVVFSIVERSSFIEASTIRDQVCRILGKEEAPQSVPVVLVGNKCDLEAQREVSAEDGMSLAASWNVPYLEASAKTRTNVKEIFLEAVRMVMETQTAASGTEEAASTPQKKEKSKNKLCTLL